MMQRFYRRIDWWLERLKWPVAVVAVLWTPLLIWAWILLGYRLIEQPFALLWFTAGFISFFIAWKSILRYQRLWRWLVRTEHEATHLLFAAITGHPIIGWQPQRGSDQSELIESTKPSSKRIQESDQETNSKRRVEPPVHFVGDGNWLIQIAPYFFPTAAGILWLAALFIPLGFLGWTTIALGLATAFHVTSTIIEIRADRDELQQIGWRFCWMFLPSANLLLLGCLLSFSQQGLRGMIQFISDSWQPLGALLNFLKTQIS